MTPGTSGNSCGFGQFMADQRPKFEGRSRSRKRKKSKLPPPAYKVGKLKYY